MLNSPGVQDGSFLLEVDGNAVIDRADVLYRDVPLQRDPDSAPAGATPTHHPNSELDGNGGLLGSLLGGLGLTLESDGAQVLSTAQALANSSIDTVLCNHGDDMSPDHSPHPIQEIDEPTGFEGVFFRSVSLVSQRRVWTLTPLNRRLALSLEGTIRSLPRQKTSLSGSRIFRFISMIPSDNLYSNPHSNPLYENSYDEPILTRN